METEKAIDELRGVIRRKVEAYALYRSLGEEIDKERDLIEEKCPPILEIAKLMNRASNLNKQMEEIEGFNDNEIKAIHQICLQALGITKSKEVDIREGYSKAFTIRHKGIYIKSSGMTNRKQMEYYRGLSYSSSLNEVLGNGFVSEELQKLCKDEDDKKKIKVIFDYLTNLSKKDRSSSYRYNDDILESIKLDKEIIDDDGKKVFYTDVNLMPNGRIIFWFKKESGMSNEEDKVELENSSYYNVEKVLIKLYFHKEICELLKFYIRQKTELIGKIKDESKDYKLTLSPYLILKEL